MSSAAFRFIDLFAGIGGMRYGFEAIGGTCVFASEWDKYARLTYAANFDLRDEEIRGDIREVKENDIPPHDVLLAGFPCQPFSIAGVSKKNALNRPHGFACEMQGNLFFEIVRILRYHRPKAFLLENVRNLVNHDKGRTFRIIRETLEDDLKYDIFPAIIDAKGWVPQHRERIFIVGFPRERRINGFSLHGLQEQGRQTSCNLGSILHPEDGSEEEEPPYTYGPKAKVAEKYILSDHLWNYLQNYAAKHRAKGNGFGYGLVGPEDISRTLSARYYKDGSEILITRGENRNPRRLTPRECARLMGFPDSFKIPVSDTQAYKQFGNAVVVPVVTSIARQMLPWIIDQKRTEGVRKIA